MIFEIKKEGGDEFVFFKGKIGDYFCYISDEYGWNTFIFTKEEIKELISYLQGEIQNEN